MTSKNLVRRKKQNVDDYIDDEINYEAESWFSNGLHKFIIILSLAWFGFVAIYINNFFGWDKLFAMLPNEFSAFMAGITLPLAFLWVVIAYICRSNNFKNETQILRDSINQAIFPDSDGSAFAKMISEAIKEQVIDLKEVTKDAFAQADVIKRDLTDRVADFRDLLNSLDNYSSKTILQLNEEVKKLIDSFSFVNSKVSSATSDFRVHSMQMKDDSEQIANILTPIVNEMVTAAERVKEVVNVNNENIEKAKAQLNDYSESSQLYIGKIIESWSEKGENLERAFLRTAENCEEMFKRLDSGISHIETSVAEQKGIVDEQSSILDKNTVYLDSKLGEYGKLISIEVEAMIERSNTLEQNLQSQMNGVRLTAQQVNDVFNLLGSNFTEKRKVIETESLRIMNGINLIITNLSEEVKKLNEFYSNTQNTNGEMGKVFSSVSTSLNDIEKGLAESLTNLEQGLNNSLDNVKTGLANSLTDTEKVLSDSLSNFTEKSSILVDKINSVGIDISSEMTKLLEKSDSISDKSKENVNLISTQNDNINNSLSNLDNLYTNVNKIKNDLEGSTNSLGEILNNYEEVVSNINKSVNKQIDVTKDNFEKTTKQLEDLDRKIKLADIDTFMNNSADIVSELEAISVDINQIFDNEIETNEMWSKFYEGDHGIFARNIAKKMTKKEIKLIKDSYENKVDFRVIVDKYIDDFNDLILRAKENNRARILLALISGSDIGKIYYIISRALGKIN